MRFVFFSVFGVRGVGVSDDLGNFAMEVLR